MPGILAKLSLSMCSLEFFPGDHSGLEWFAQSEASSTELQDVDSRLSVRLSEGKGRTDLIWFVEKAAPFRVGLWSFYQADFYTEQSTELEMEFGYDMVLEVALLSEKWRKALERWAAVEEIEVLGDRCWLELWGPPLNLPESWDEYRPFFIVRDDKWRSCAVFRWLLPSEAIKNASP